MSSNIESQWLGLQDYDTALQMQADLCEHLSKNPHRVFLLGLEHPSVITLGKRGSSENDILKPGIMPVFKIDRGGQATLHSPGQLVVYPLINIKSLGLTPKSLVDLILDVTQKVLRDFGIKSEFAEGAGLLVHGRKIAFLGLRIQRGLSSHGLSLNVSNDLSEFAAIRSCGCAGASLTRLQDLGVPDSPRQIFGRWSLEFESRLKQLAPQALL